MRRKTSPRPHMLIMRGLRNDQIELRERAAVQAFSLGCATTVGSDYVPMIDQPGPARPP